MRVSREQVEENRRTILDAAGRLFRERGFEAVTVAEVMKAAGLTHGGFYGYFKSKDDLIAQTLAGLFGNTGWVPRDLAPLLTTYLSPAHRDDRAGGCPVAALATETIRQPEAVRTEMTEGLLRNIERLRAIAPGADAAAQRREAIGTYAAMVGAMIMARASNDAQLSETLLTQTREWLELRGAPPAT